MIDVLANSKAPKFKYDLVENGTSFLKTVELTKYEAHTFNRAFGLNHVNKKYVPTKRSHKESKLILPNRSSY
tara:strand:- start:35 stop:250 length:216 start_codon:yes stop_codon:yes gene_type:complete